MPTSVLTLVQDFCEKMNLPVPSALVGSTEKSIRQYRSLLREIVSDLLEYSWQQQRLRKEWLATAGEDQGTLESIFGAGYLSLVPDTMWNQTRVMRVFGPIPDTTWQALKVLPNAGPEFQCWISNNRLYVSPGFANLDSLAAVYTTKYGVLSSGGVPKERVTVDTDTLLFPDNVVLRGFEYKWRKQKGEAGWEDDYNDFMGLVARNIVKDGAPRFTLATPDLTARPGIVIPAGSWNV